MSCSWPLVLVRLLLAAGLGGGVTSLGAVAKSKSPQFLSPAETFSVDENSVVRLPCVVKHQGVHVIVWRRGRRVLSARSSVVSRDRRFQLAIDGALVIRPVRPADAGVYTCQLDTEPLLELQHQLEVFYSARVRVEPSDGVVSVETGHPAELRCSATGHPAPTLYWRKQVGQLPGGVQQREGSVYVIDRVTRSMAGVYECVGDNGHGPPGVTAVTLSVLYAPEVYAQQSTVSTGVGRTARLECLVSADPAAKVDWLRTGVQVDSRRHTLTAEHGVDLADVSVTRHTLVIDLVSPADLGTYTCRARNQLGKAHRRMVLSGNPGKAEVISDPISTSSDFYQLAWQVTSYEGISEYKVAYRLNKLNQSDYLLPADWREVLVPATGSELVHGSTYRQRIPLRRLRPASVYAVHVRARNQHGWGGTSDVFHFSTLGRGQAFTSTAGSVVASESLCGCVWLLVATATTVRLLVM